VDRAPCVWLATAPPVVHHAGVRGFRAGLPLLGCVTLACGRIGYAATPDGAGDGLDACVDGPCADRAPDEDGDGVERAQDCDDTDETVGANAIVECASPCGVGFARCVAGRWGDCDAPTECRCMDGETQEVPCGRCGTFVGTCVGGEWLFEGPCAGQGECLSGSIGKDDSACMCGAPTCERSRTRTCLDTCEWDGWSGWGACVDPDAA
jgi:hypothetical protein